MSAARSGKPDRRHSASHPCPVCGGHDAAHRGQGERCHGFLSGDFIHCSREEHAGQAPYHANSQTWSHRAEGECKCGYEHRPAPAKPAARAKRGPRTASFDYRGPDGALLFRVARFGDGKGKTFSQCRVVDGKEVWGLGDVTPVPYKLPELLAADPSAPVYVPEGEKHCDRLTKFGLVASCNPMGAEKWRDGYSPHFEGRDCVLLADNDATGERHVEKVAASLAPFARSVKIVRFPEVPEKGDVLDWLDKGHTIADLKRLAAEAKPWTPATKPKPKADEAPPTIPIRPGGPGPVAPRFNLTDLGNAERLVARHGADLRYCHPWKKWLVWDGRRWAVDDTAAARRLAKETTRSIYAEARDEPDDDRRKALGRHAVASEKRDRQAAMLSLAEMDRPILPDAMDGDPWAFNALNGTVDLRTGELRPPRREDLITALCPVEFDQDAECPLWLATLDLFFGGDAGMIGYFQRICGYALCGVVRDHVLPIAYGIGSNGKSTMLGTLLELLGPDYAMKAPPDMLMAKRGETHPTDRSDLFGKRLVVAIESEAGRRLNETMVKELTGGDKIRARRMREDFWEFSPTHTLIMATNHKPVIRGTDEGIWRRLRLVPFTVRVEGKAADKTMPEKLRAEFAGILAWCVRGCLAWQAEGLAEPKGVAEATGDYRRESDTLGAFVEERCIVHSSCRAKAGDLYASYRQWAEKGGETPQTQRQFGTAMTERGFERFTNNGTWYSGIGVKDASSGDDGPAF